MNSHQLSCPTAPNFHDSRPSLRSCPTLPGNSHSFRAVKTWLWRYNVPQTSWSQGARLPTHHTPDRCQSIWWQLDVKHLLRLSSHASEEHEASFKSPTAQRKFGLVSNMRMLLVTKLSHLLLCVYDSRLFHHMLLFFQAKMLNKANKHQT